MSSKPGHETIEEILDAFAGYQDENHLAATNTIGMRLASAKRHLSYLRDDEPHTAEYAYEHLDDLQKRWLKDKKDISGGTAETYYGRTKRLLADYLQFANEVRSLAKHDAVVYDQKSGTSAVVQAKSPEGTQAFQSYIFDFNPFKATPVNVAPTGPLAKLAQEQKALSKARNERTIILDDGKVFTYYVPENGLVIADVAKIVVSLLASSTVDFDFRQLPSVLEVFENEKLKKKGT